MKQSRPTLNIDDIVLLKSNPKEYLEKELEKLDLIEEDIVKHPVTEHARNIGFTRQKGEIYEENGKKYYDVSYSDGTKITYEVEGKGRFHEEEREETVKLELNDNLRGVIEDIENEYPLYEDSLEHEIHEQHPEFEEIWIDDIPEWDGNTMEVPIRYMVSVYDGTTEHETIASVTSPDGEKITLLDEKDKTLDNIGGTEIDKLNADDKKAFDVCLGNFGQPIASFELGRKDDMFAVYAKQVAQGKNPDKIVPPDYEYKTWEDPEYGAASYKWARFSVTEFPEIMKKNEIPKDTPSFMTIQHTNELPEGEGMNKGIVTNQSYRVDFCNNYRDPADREEKNQDWTIITLHEQGNPARTGAKNPIDDSFITPPGAKSERYLIDQNSKTIIQRPYKPGMDRHIWG